MQWKGSKQSTRVEDRRGAVQVEEWLKEVALLR